MFNPQLTCFEGEDETGSTANITTPPTDSGGQAAPKVGDRVNGRDFTQDDLNKFLAEDRRKHQEKYQRLEKSYESILQDQTMETNTRTELEGELEDLRKSFRTKEQQAEVEKKKQRNEYEETLKAAKHDVVKFQQLYTDTVITQSLQDAAIEGEAFNSQQIISLLRPITDLRELKDEAGKATGNGPMVDFPDVDEKTGKPIKTLRTPSEAVKRMKELTGTYGNLFRANVVSGVGQGAATGGVLSGKTGQIDIENLPPEQYRKIRKERPELLGLRPNK